MVGWAYFSMPTQEELQRRQAQQIEQARQDSLAALQPDSQTSPRPQQADTLTDTTIAGQSQLTSKQQEEQTGQTLFRANNPTDTTEVVIQTPLYKTTFTNLGAGPAAFMLK